MRLTHLTIAALLLLGCGDDTSRDTGSTGSPACEPRDPSSYFLNMEMREVTSPVTRIVYGCPVCTREQFDAIATPEGWEKNIPNRILSTRSSVEHFTVEGVPSNVDFIDEIPGAEWELIAVVEGVSFDTGAPVATVRRNTVFTFPACSRVHRLTDPTGRTFLLFAVIDDLLAAGFDLDAEDAFADRTFPAGWTYDSYVLESDLTVDSGGRATVYNHLGESTWQVFP
jgi:hypothetical protein